MLVQPKCMEMDYLYANFMEGSVWKGSPSHCGRVSLLLQTFKNKINPLAFISLQLEATIVG